MLYEEAKSGEFVLMSNAGGHASEGLTEIINRKRDDIKNAGNTVWLVNSNKGTPDKIQSFCDRTSAQHVVFVAPITLNVGPATDERAVEYSKDNENWKSFDVKLGDVTGYVRRNTTGLWLSELELVPSAQIDFAFYKALDGPDDGELRFWPSDNAIPAQKRNQFFGSGVPRNVVAVGRLASPYAVWMRK